MSQTQQGPQMDADNTDERPQMPQMDAGNGLNLVRRLGKGLRLGALCGSNARQDP
jgi:hypothetical protein